MYGESPKFKAYFEVTDGDTLESRHIKAQYKGFRYHGFLIFPVDANGFHRFGDGSNISDDCTRFSIYFMYEGYAKDFSKAMGVEYFPCEPTQQSTTA